MLALPASELADAVGATQHHAQALLDLAAATVATAPAADAAASSSGGGDTSWFGPLTNSLEAVLKQIQGVLVKLNVPYSYGYSIILLTVFVKILTYPLTKKQVHRIDSTAQHSKRQRRRCGRRWRCCGARAGAAACAFE